jgi:hypothetical protein
VLELIASMKKDSLEIERVSKQIDDPKVVTNMMGYFGPAKYKSKPWYKRIFK